MNRILCAIAIVTISSFCSCTSDVEEIVNDETKVEEVVELSFDMGATDDYVADNIEDFNLTQVNNLDSRTTVATASGNRALWASGDLVSVLDTELSNRKFELKSGQGTTNGRFFGNVISQNTAYAIYPYSTNYEYNEANFTISNVEVKHVYNTTRTGDTSSSHFVEPGSNIQVAKLYSAASGTSWAFNQMCACIKVKFPTSTTEAALFSNSGEPIAGKATIGYDGSLLKPYFKTVDDPYTYINLKPGSDSYLKADTYYYFYVIPGTLSSGFSISIKNGVMDTNVVYAYTKSATDGLELKAGQVIDLGNPFASSGTWHYVPRKIDMGSMEVLSCDINNMWTTDTRVMYAWAMTEPGTNSYDTYKWKSGGTEAEPKMTKYVSKTITEDGKQVNNPKCASSYAGDNYTEMQTSDDVAYLRANAHGEGAFRIPTGDMYRYINNNYVIEPKRVDGKNCYYITSNNGKTFVIGNNRYYPRDSFYGNGSHIGMWALGELYLDVVRPSLPSFYSVVHLRWFCKPVRAMRKK